jgi:D-glucuronyl C5-epimerase C-terminus
LVLVVLSVVNQESLFKIAHSQKKQSEVKLDNSSVPIVDYGQVGGVDIGSQRNPVTITIYALSYYDSYNRTGNETFLQKFLNNTNWIVKNAVPMGNYSLLQYQFPWPKYDVQPPWQSGMAQGKALEVLTKAHALTGNQTYLDTAKSLLNAFFVEVKDGGVTYKTPNSGWWYEEYAGPKLMETRVLNGMTFALLGVYEYYKHTQDPAAKFIFDQGVIALKNELPRYEYATGQYSTYDILNNSVPNSLNYHLAQTAHLGILYDITGEDIFKTYHDSWSDYKLPEKVEQKLKSKAEELKPIRPT